MANECDATSIFKLMLMLIRVHFTLIMIALISFNINSDNSKLFTTALRIDHYSHPDYYYKSSSAAATTTTIVPRKERHHQRHHQTAYEMNMNDLQQPLTRQTSGKKSSNQGENLPQEQKLALQIFITDPSNHGRKSSGVQHRKHSNILIGKKRPYDIVQEDTIISNNHHHEHHQHLKNYTPSERHFYMLSPISSPLSSSTESTNNNNSSIPSGDTNSSSITNKTVSLNGSKNNLLEPPLLKVLASDDQREVSSRKPILNNRIELVRTQHRPPWRKKPPSQSILMYMPVKTPDPASSESSSTSTTTSAPATSATTPRSLNLEPETSYLFGVDSDSLIGRRMPHRTTTTTVPSTTSTTSTTFPPTTEFYKLISSAHSPVDTATESLNYIPRRRINGKPFGANTMDYHDAYDNFHNHHKIDGPATRIRVSEQPVTTTPTAPTTTYPMRTQTRFRPTSPYMSSSSSLSSLSNNLNMSDGHAVSPEILVSGSNEDIGSSKKRGNLIRINGINRNGEDVSRPSLDFSPTLDEVPLTVFDGKRKVTIIRHSTKSQPPPSQILIRRATATTTQPPAITANFQSSNNFSQQQNLDNLISQIPSNIRIKNEESFVNLNSSSSTMPTNQLVRMISKHKNKYDDNVKSNTLTVVDNDAIRLPPNATSVHNKLIVAIRPGRPRRYPSTTQFPVYNIVAGITPPSIPIPTNNHTQSPFVRPNSPEGSVFGLLKPEVTTTTQQPSSSSSSSFGAQNIKFPAPLPTQLQPIHVEIQDKLNISVPDSANILGPHKIPDKILMETDEQHERPPDALVISDATIVSRPYGSNTVINQDGIMKLGTTTTRKPTRHYTTKRINIVASNTTVVHQFNHPTHQHNTQLRPPPPAKPSFLVHLGNIFNAGITTSAIAILTLVKTIFTIILVMFLPPIALTAAITQAIALG